MAATATIIAIRYTTDFVAMITALSAYYKPGNCDWVITIEGINASGWSIPPFVILTSKVY